MSWLSSIFTAIITAAIGAVVSGYFANLAVRWYRISAFEGGSSWFVVGLTFCGLIAGLLIGLVISRVVAASANPNWLNALLFSSIMVLSVTAGTGGVARLLADIPPTIGGEPLLLHVEVRWPTSRTESPANTPGVAYLDLGSSASINKPEPKRGALWKEDARNIDGRWTVSGVAPMFTSRAAPVIEIALNATERTSFRMPSLSHPTTGDSVWSPWLPMKGNSGTTNATEIDYRYRVTTQQETVRTERIGAFAVGAIVSYFKPVDIDGLSTTDFYGSFRVSFQDKPLLASGTGKSAESSTAASSVAVLPGAQTTLLAAVNGEWMLLGDDNGTLRTQHISDGTSSQPLELTNDPKRMAETRRPQDPRGRIDRTTYARSHMLLFEDAVLNIDTREVHKFSAKSTASLVPSVPPLGVSPDGHSVVRFVMGSVNSAGEYAPLLAVTDFVRDTVYELPIDRSRMRYGKLDELNADWLAHHFVWKGDANGVDRLQVRSDFTAIPYSGIILKDSNDLLTYLFTSGGQPVRQVLADFLKAEFHATGDTSNAEAHAWVLQIGENSINLETPGGRETYVRTTLIGNATQSDLIARIAKAFNAALATGKYDRAFAQP